MQIDSKRSETRNEHEIGDAEFLSVAGANSRRSTNFTSRECQYKLPNRISSDLINKCGLGQ